MQQTCAQPWCQEPFEVTEEDVNFLDRIAPIFNKKKEAIPPPTLCPACREQRRFAWRNEWHLHRRACASCAKPIISIYASAEPHVIYCKECWWKDSFDPRQWGRDYDPSQSFFAQFDALLKAVPQPGSGFWTQCENCDYCNYQNDSRHCYLCFGSGWMEDSAYTNWTYYAKNVFDTLGCSHCELSSNLVDCTTLYGCDHCQDCSTLTDCRECKDCHGCQDCFGCVGLRRKRFCYLNETLSEAAYRARIAGIDWPTFRKSFRALVLSVPHRARFQLNCEGSNGDHLVNCKNCNDSFYLWDSQDNRFCTDIIEEKDSYDCTRTGLNELCYETVCGGRYYHTLWSTTGDTLSDCFYSSGCYYSKHLFGCTSMRHSEYCILNKQYTQEEYNALVPRIIERMRKDGEWGEFFPLSRSPFAYNESVAQDFYPLGQEEVERRTWLWRQTKDEKPQVTKIIPAERLPQKIEDIPDDILNWAIQCEVTKRPFKIIRQELEFYRRMNLPVPHFHPDERHRQRMAQRNPRKIWKRTCAKCQKPIETTYAPDRPERVYCENCYLKEVY